MTRITMRCPHCGSEDIIKDAAAEWDTETQKWVLASVHDHEICADCERSGDDMAERHPAEGA